MHNKNFNVLQSHYDIIVFSHLRWEFVFQRPQHIVTRLAAERNILFVEEPIANNNEGAYKLIHPTDSVTVLQPMVASINDIGPLLKNCLQGTTFNTAWFYSPSFINVLNHLQFEKVVYDCMDELTLFKGAPPELINQEDTLLGKANIVFTGGKLLYESKRKKHPHVHCFPSSVDYNHFQKALNGIAIPADMLFKGPIVGYYGVIDERIDYDLLSAIAHDLKEVSFVMIGPLAKVNAADLPQAVNLHYLGMKDYALLPAYLKAMDVAMMPFALNQATKYISPTKTLEYMAAHKPVISTPIYDVIRDYGSIIDIVADAKGFAAVLNKILQRTEKEKEAMVDNYERVLAATSWDKTVKKMEEILKLTQYENAI